MMELELIKIVGSNATGILFGVLMYNMANKTLRKQTEALQELIIEIKKRK